MNMTDIIILTLILIGLIVTIILMKKTKKENCSGTCIGCAQEKSCRVKNFKEEYDRDKSKPNSNEN